jgi:hypothetical protein
MRLRFHSPLRGLYASSPATVRRPPSDLADGHDLGGVRPALPGLISFAGPAVGFWS